MKIDQEEKIKPFDYQTMKYLIGNEHYFQREEIYLCNIFVIW